MSDNVRLIAATVSRGDGSINVASAGRSAGIGLAGS
jgi:hypothetical protein